MRIQWQPVVAFFFAVWLSGTAQQCAGADLLQGIVLIGAKTEDTSQSCSIQLISRKGNQLRTLIRHETGTSYPGGRVSRSGDRVAWCVPVGKERYEFHVVDADGNSKKVADGRGMITAWSHDDSRIAVYRSSAANKGAFESLVINVETGEETLLKLPADYLADDWHPKTGVRTALFMNPRNRMYRKLKGDNYPTRQLDLLSEDGTLKPLTKNPSTDNIWSRFSPKGDRIAHYGRTLDGETALEYGVVCQADGSEPAVVFEFAKFGMSNGLPWFRPFGSPAWSPDGKLLAWLVHSNPEAKSDGEKLELLLIPTGQGEPKRILLAAEIGIRWVSGIDWR